MPSSLSPRWIFLDFDGVIMDSMALKLDAYCFALAEYGFSRERIREQQLLYAGLSRARALPLMYANLSDGGSLSPEAQSRALARFAEEDIRLRPRMRLMPGAMEFLEEAARRTVPLVVVTGTPQEVIDGTMEAFNLRRWFRELHGSPPVKAERFPDLLARHGLRADEVVYVGDAIQDQRAAAIAGIPFIGVDTGDHPFADPEPAPVAILSGLGEMAGLLGWL